MKKMIALLLSEMISFPATFVAGNDIIIMGNIKVLK